MMKINKNSRWNDDFELNFLEQNYQNMTNKQMAEKLGRTEDGVRKQLYKMGLKRISKSKINQKSKPVKSKIKKLIKLKKEAISAKEKQKKQIEKLAAKKDKELQKKESEKKWYNQNFINKEELPESKIGQYSKTILLAGKSTTIFASSKQKLQKACKKLIDKYK